MENKKIAFFEIEDWEKEYFTKEFSDFEISFFNEPVSKENIALVKDCQIISVFANSQLDKEALLQLPELKMIATRSTGFDHIDLQETKKKGVLVCNVPNYGENTVAEHTFALILNLSRKIYQSISKTKKGDFSLDGLRGFDLKGKTIGVVGLGNIGQHVARIANGFEMQVLGFDINEDKKLSKKLGFKYVSLEELLRNSDIISLHVPYNEHTHHLINSSNIHLIKRGSYLINTARGGIIETEALAKALGDGILAGAGLDVLEEECFIKEEKELLSKEFPKKCDLKTMLQNHLLMDQENVIITPHNAFNSKEALERIIETTVLNIKSFLKNKPINIIS
ncbi:MAG: D-isomer specific 2-hydroxyacid dehydrogenase NAD-binding protein [Parcubacteria group bacterium GW2011_GWA1_33_6]|uniref:Hydroxyacid dehydrogenase n=1 Tax=Candidatus Staskawiczbacteria bacterium RIFCSPHIGHO2_02_FULL_33_16 TaxID=1802204 RepID=A0A1G2HS64_9BACT|nr:MAG: D-isomer specific 2-hydroxyacid dehydrogenase NAD-binding protein [Parcubacteria group bacterium GW2011_GWA2_33_14]KKP55282.1 MAG: D-isomer specific 2-hydroxyacid dehydrogenase NAD-binding protein [Parcubacteria group bacterium GW2011_GWA1_33_6]OGZ65317.1 MAG: hydroxyacid dehydrogenase [Candidatus Staskawiczbacteria bacterium RIFCSPHIGHO2_02_FULL_33_16]